MGYSRKRKEKLNSGGSFKCKCSDNRKINQPNMSQYQDILKAQALDDLTALSVISNPEGSSFVDDLWCLHPINSPASKGPKLLQESYHVYNGTLRIWALKKWQLMVCTTTYTFMKCMKYNFFLKMNPVKEIFHSKIKWIHYGQFHL